MHLIWTKCQGDVWCKLKSVNLEPRAISKTREGVYIIWHGGPKSLWVVYVGQGTMSRDRIVHHRLELARYFEYEHLGLFVTWAARGAEEYRNGVESYLAEYTGNQQEVGSSHHGSSST